MKKSLWIIAAAFVLAACNKEAVKPEEPIVEDSAPVEYTFNFTVNHPSETKGIKSGWQRGDKVFFFFPGQTEGYVDMYYAEGWTTTVHGNVSINPQGGTVSALYILPTGDVNGYTTYAGYNSDYGWLIQGTHGEAFHLAAENVPYTVTVATYIPGADEIVAEVSATIDLQAPERMIQFYIPDETSQEESILFQCDYANQDYFVQGMKNDGTVNKSLVTGTQAYRAKLGGDDGYYAWRYLAEEQINSNTVYSFSMYKKGTWYFYSTKLPTPLASGKAVKLSSLEKHPLPVFTVSASGDKVIISSANLITRYYQTWYWRFGEEYYPMGDNAGNKQISDAAPWVSVESSAFIDLFGWSTNANFFGINSSENDSDYSGDFVDWGDEFPYATPYSGVWFNGGWRVLDKNEWETLLFSRNASTLNGTENARFAKACVHSCNGVLVFPDNYVHPTGGAGLPVNINDITASFGVNVYSLEEYLAMKEAGCIFLPAAGMRRGTDVNPDAGVYGAYWTSSDYNYSDQAWYCYFTDSIIAMGSQNRHVGQAVRLVVTVKYP